MHMIGVLLKPNKTSDSKRNRWIESIESFVRKNIQEPLVNNPAALSSGREVKIALIDDGVDAFSEELKGIIFSPGWPRQKPTDNVHPFYRSATGHGTAMATLIKTACPKIRLYVAKLNQSSHWTATQQDRTDALSKRSTAETAANVRKL